jgi:alpha-N-acetylglucosamine transferase
MLSILLCNGRNEVAAYILPTTDGYALRLGFEALKSLKAMLQLKADNESVLDEAKLEKLIKDTLRLDSATIKNNQQMNQNYVLEHIIDRNPGFLSKKVLVFPQNEWDQHWSVKFETEDESKPSCFATLLLLIL